MNKLIEAGEIRRLEVTLQSALNYAVSGNEEEMQAYRKIAKSVFQKIDVQITAAFIEQQKSK